MPGLQQAEGASMSLHPQWQLGLGSLGEIPSVLEFELSVRFAIAPEVPRHLPRMFD
jgi:hypothetical protein